MPKYYVRKDGLHEAIRVINGKRVAFRGKTDREVERKLREYKEEQDKGPLFSVVAKEWKEEHEKNIEKSTAGAYLSHYKNAVAEFGEKRINKITPAEINSYGVKQKEKGFKRSTVSQRFVVLRMIFNYAVLQGYIKYSPCAAVKLPSGLRAEKRELPRDEVLKIIDKSEWLLPFFLLYSGLRRAEAVVLTFGDIDKKNKLITVNKAAGYDGEIPYLKAPKSSAGNRKVILLDKLADRIPDGNPNDLIFPGADGQIYRSGNFYNEWHRWQAKMGIDVTPHQLRHGFATLLLEAGLDTKDAQDQLGHSSEAMTKGIYEHIRDKRRKISAEKLNATANIFTE